MRHPVPPTIALVALLCAADAAYAVPFNVTYAAPPPDDHTRTGAMGKKEWIAVFCIIGLFILVFVAFCYFPKLCLHRPRQRTTIRDPFSAAHRRHHRSHSRSNVSSDWRCPTPRRVPSPPPSFQDHHLSPLVSPPASIVGSSVRTPSLTDDETLVGSLSGPASPCGGQTTPSCERQEPLQFPPPAYPLAHNLRECAESPRHESS